ncbi:amino acid adenylation domain-containing protein [Luteimonas sp. A277]
MSNAGNVLGLFHAAVDADPTAPAVSWRSADTSYRELDERSNQVANALISGGAPKGTIVAILLDNPLEQIIATLGCLKAGCVFASLDATWSERRLLDMLGTMRAQWLILEAATAPVAAGLMQAHRVGTIVSMDTDGLLAGQFAGQPVEVLQPSACARQAESVSTQPDDPCYVYFTSGSTGRPKGIVGRIRGLAHFIEWEIGEFKLGPGSRISQLSGPAFDVYLRDVFAALCSGGTVCIPPAGRLPAPVELADWIQRERITLVHCVPSVFRILLAADLSPESFPALKLVLLAGESLAPADANNWIALFGERIRLVNLYGPTETTLAKFFHRLPATPVDGTFVPIGKPIPGAQALLLDGNLEHCPPGEIGETFISTPYRSLGYCNEPGLTAAAFLRNPYGNGPDDLLYRTGDLAQLMPDGNYRFAGRRDFQVKIRGNRVEPGEIEAHMRECPGVREAVVVAREDRPGDVRLVGYYVLRAAAAGEEVTPVGLRSLLAGSLPAYMVPDLCIALERMPLSVNGKLDRAALPAPGSSRPDLAVAYAPPVGAREQQVCAAFAAVLCIERAGRHDNFFDLGGNSMLAVQLLGRLQQHAERPLPATLIYAHPTPASFAAALVQGAATDVGQRRFAGARRDAPGAAGQTGPAHEPVAIIAMAGRFPGAADVEAFWDNLCAGRDSITVFAPDELDPSVALADRMHPSYVTARGIIEDVEQFDAAFFGISPREAELMDPQHRIFLELCWECMERGGEIPDASTVPVGVFAGTYHSTYLRRHVAAHPELVDEVGTYQVTLANEKDYIATRVAHKLNLTGPAISMYTACSTSLVAICQAMDSLRAGACDMALAGGSSVVCPPRSGHIYQDGAMLSPDGHTRTFDAAAKGTVFSDGAAVVLLKRLSDAIRDGNPVYAVIKGGAVNNDGGGKASFTAPSSDGQAAVIAMAHARAGVSPRDISYLEAHGTATPMGDPIEIEGLVKAFRRGTADNGFCRIGSVKSNFGHLVIAAGAAGVIKTALSLAERRLPPSLHFEHPNPAIDFPATPFVVNAAMSEWSDADGPLRAGVSSFGVGGTNAHVVLEQAPVLPASEPGEGPQLLVLSARSPAALGTAATQLADFLESAKDINLADVAWTLAAGRKAFAHRAVVVASEATAAAAALRSPELATTIRRSRPARHREVVFMFPGQGSHYAGMGRALYQAEPGFAAAFDQCVEGLSTGRGLDLRALVFGDDPAALLPTGVMQPAIFSMEYALARLWMERGLEPVAMIGHSFGELVAATLAGVFSLPDALRLVALRGALMQAQPTGGMLTVRMASDELLARLPPGLSLAAENAPGASVASGPTEEVERLKAQLDAEGVACRMLQTSHAFHSKMMEPVVAPLLAEIEAIQRSAPMLPLVSTATGEWLDADTANSPEYWARHLLEPVRFATALGRVLETPGRVLLEVGTRTTLTSLSRQHPALQQQGATTVASLADSPANEISSFRLAAGQLWAQGVDLDPGMFDRRNVRHRLRLPTYPFERKRFWVEAAPAVAVDHRQAQAAPVIARAVDTPAEAVMAQEGAAGQMEYADRQARLLAQLRTLFGGFLGMEIDIEDNSTSFVELGLDSLMLTQVARKLQGTFDVPVTFRQLMGESGSLERLAAWLDRELPATESLPQGPRPAEAGPDDGPAATEAPTTASQQEIWLAGEMGREGALAFNLSMSLRMRGRLDVQALRSALKDLVARHDALRSRLSTDGQTLHVLDDAGIDLKIIDLTALDNETREARLQERVRLAAEETYELDAGPLFRAELLQLEDGEHLLLLAAHHVICDGWSWGLVVRELGVLYRRQLGEPSEALPEPASFLDYARNEATRTRESLDSADEAYWLSRFQTPPAPLDLPADRVRPARRSFVSARVDHTIDEALLDAVRSMGASRGASLFATLLAGLSGLLSRLSGQSDIVIAIPAAGQPAEGHESLVGHCVNTLPLRFDVDPSKPFPDLVEDSQAHLLDAMEHRRCTFGTLLSKLRIARDPSRVPLVSVMFNLEQAYEKEKDAFPGLAIEAGHNPRSFEALELFVNAARVGDGLRLECQYNRDLYDEGTVRRWLRAYEALLRAAVDQQSVEFGDLPLVDAVEQAEQAALQPVPVPFERDRLMHEYFELQCDRSPDRIAVSFGASSFSYAELEERSNRIAHLLRSHGVRRGALVGLAVDRGFDMLAALLGTLKAGAGYVPLDPGFPHERLAYMAADAGLAALLTTREHASVFDLQGRPVLVLDELETALGAAPGTRLGRDAGAAEPEGPAYVIYTSGTTGRPKGVQVPHRAVSNFLVSMRHEPGLCADDRLLAVTTLSFDIAVLELLLPLGVGATIVLADELTGADGFALAGLLASSAATVLQGTPSTWQMLLEAGWQGAPGFKALCGGEPLQPELATQLLSRCGELWNLYGPTETTVWSTVARILPASDAGGRPDVGIGHPIANTRIWMLDPRGGLCPAGVAGEIAIGGEGVTLGYLDRPELTADRFVTDRFSTDMGAGPGLLYRTGDLGRWRADGRLEHLGRLDFQVKIRGHRIELGEVEAVLAQCPGVARVTAVAREDRPGDVRLVAYMVAQAGAVIGVAACMAYLRQQVPDYMVPQHLVTVAEMPLLPNGKIDRGALPAPLAPSTSATPSRKPRSEAEERIAAIMAGVLGVPSVDVEDDFFALGGHSLLGARLLARIGREFGVQLSLDALFAASTTERLAEQVEAGGNPHVEREEIARQPDQSQAPLSRMQQRVWVQEQLLPGQAAFTITTALRLTGPLDVRALESALAEVVRRQPTLRTEVSECDDGEVQRVLEQMKVVLPLEDLSSLPPADIEAEATRRMVELSTLPIALDQAPLFRARLFRLGARTHVFFFMVHHAIWDGVSRNLFCAELAAVYAAMSEGRDADLPELERSYVDFVHWHLARAESPEARRQLAFWKESLSGERAPLQLPEDLPRPSVPTGRGGSEPVRLDAPSLARLREVGAGADASLFMTLLAAYFTWLHRMTGQQDLLVGVPVRGHVSEAMDRVMGFFVNILPVRVRVDPDMPFVELLKHVRRAVLDCFANPDLALEDLVRELGLPRDPSRSTIYQALFSFQEAGHEPAWGALTCERMKLPHTSATTDLALWCQADGRGLVATLNYNADIIAPGSAARMRRGFEALLASVHTGPETPVGKVDCVGAADGGPQGLNAASEPLEAATAAIHIDGQVTGGSQPQTRSEFEQRIAAIMADVLGVPRVDVDVDFFALGGHSLLGARLLGRIRRELQVQLPLGALFKASTVEQLAKLAMVARGGELDPEEIPRQADQSLAPLSRMQQRVWVQEQILPDRVAYTINSAWRLSGRLDAQALQSALAEVVRRQPTLRTQLEDTDGVVVQRVLEHVAVSLPVEDLSMLPPEDVRSEATRRMAELSTQPIALDKAPLFRARLYRLDAQTHVFFFMVHHAIWDGVSQNLFGAELAALYAALSEGRTADLPELERSYVDFVHWHLARAEGAEARRQLAFWKESLSGELAPLQLPEDRPRPSVPTGRGGSEPVRLDAPSLARLREVGASADASLFMTLLAAYFAWLHRMTGQQDLVVGVPVRGHLSEAMDRVMGFFVNILPVRVRVDPEMPFLELLKQVRRAALDAFANPDVALEDLMRELGLRRDPGRSPIYQAVFSFQEAGPAPAWGTLASEPLQRPHTSATTDLALWCQADGRGLVATLNYNADIIVPESAASMRRGFEALLASVHAGPEIAVGDIDCLGAEDRRALEEWNATSVPLQPPASVHAMVMAQLRATPTAASIHFEGQVTTCSQLQARSERIASALAARGVTSGDLVGVCLDRDVDLVAGMIGVLLAGAAYVPLDPAYPPDRLRFMAEDADLKLVVSKGDLAAPLQWPREQQLLLDADGAQIASATPAVFPEVGPDAPAYVIYTSGSTGKPKGVSVPHGAVVNFLRSMQREPGIVPSDRLLAATTTSFDIAVLELFLPLAAGASIVLATREQLFDGAALARLLDASQATLLQGTPSVWRLLLETGWRARPGLKALCGGEPLPEDLARQLLAQGVELWNMYGPTETTVWSTCARVQAPERGGALDIHIGRPIDNTTVWVLDARDRPCAPGVPGEIHIGGAGMSLGYHDRPELNAERFIPNPFPGVARFNGSTLPALLYRTGDRGRWRHDGVLRHEGRLDFQVKLRGHRIEPGEIETLLVARNEVARALVMVREDRPGDERLVAYVVAATGAGIEDDALRSHLRGLLPAYMVPQHFVALAALPLLPNGKVDRNALPVPSAHAVQAPREVAGVTDPRVLYLSEVWSRLLGMSAGPEDNFFDLGGHSMLAVQMANRVERETGVRIKLIRLGAETLAQVAEGLPMSADGAEKASGFRARIGNSVRRLFKRTADSPQ